jgi:hypothetical protein
MYLLRRGDTDDLRISKRERSLFRGLLGTDELVYDSQEPPLGSHLVTPRRGYLHYGIYVGGCKVVNYSRLAQGMRRRPVEEVPLARFARGQHVWVRSRLKRGWRGPNARCSRQFVSRYPPIGGRPSHCIS